MNSYCYLEHKGEIMPSTKTIIKTEDAKRVFTTGEVEVHALRGVNLDIKQGEFVVILGASGSGKTNCAVNSSRSNMSFLLTLPTTFIIWPKTS